jgi:polysaccharide biosynthesis protein PslH
MRPGGPRMRILFITEQFPYPLHDGGNLRTYHILRALAGAHRLTLVSHEPRDPHASPVEILPDVERIHCVAKPGTAQRLVHSTLRFGLGRFPLFVLKNWSAPLLEAVDRLLATESFDALHFNHLDTACYALERRWPMHRVFDTHNCLSAMAQQVARDAGNGVRRLLFRRESRLLAQCELEACQQMGASLVCSPQDALAFQSLGVTRPLPVIPNGVDTGYFCSDPATPTEPGRLAFTGAMNYYPNEQAVLWFCREVLPLLSDYRPAVRFYIVGKNPTPAVRSLHNGTSVHVTGAVPDVRDYVRRAEVFVVPLQHGSGTRLKILEAFAMGKAVASTRLGAEGIAGADDEHMVLGDTAPELAGQIRRLLGDQALRRRLGENAQLLARGTYGWDRIGRMLLETYAGLGTQPAARAVQVNQATIS